MLKRRVIIGLMFASIAAPSVAKTGGAAMLARYDRECAEGKHTLDECKHHREDVGRGLAVGLIGGAVFLLWAGLTGKL